MIARLNIIDRIMMPALLLVSLLIMVNAFIVGFSSIDKPITAQWVLSIVGFAYVLYQAIRIGSPLLTVTTATVVMVGCFGNVIVHMNYYWRNNIWEPLGGGASAIAASMFVLVIVLLPVVALTYVAFIALRKRKKTIAELALKMLREYKKIDAGELAKQFGISEIDAISYIAESQRKGIIPFKADIV